MLRKSDCYCKGEALVISGQLRDVTCVAMVSSYAMRIKKFHPARTQARERVAELE